MTDPVLLENHAKRKRISQEVDAEQPAYPNQNWSQPQVDTVLTEVEMDSEILNTELNTSLTDEVISEVYADAKPRCSSWGYGEAPSRHSPGHPSAAGPVP